MDSIVRKRFKSWWLCLLVVVMTGFLWGSFPSVAHGEDNSATVPGNATYTEDAFYYSDQYMWKVSLFVAKSDTVNKDSSTMDDFYRIGNQAVYLTPANNWNEWYAGSRPSNISGIFFSKENKVDTLRELQSKGGDVNALDPVQITTGNNVNMITGVPNLPYVPQLSDGDVYDNGVIYGDTVGSITKVANYFNSKSTMDGLLNFYANKQGTNTEGLVQGLEFTIDGEKRTNWNPDGILPDAINDNPTNQVEWVVVYEPVSIVYVKDTAYPGSYYGYALTATEFAVSQIKHQMDWRYDETRWTAWAGQQPDAWKANSDRQHVSRLAFLLMGNSVITNNTWYGLEAGSGVDQNAAIPFNRWFSDRQTKYGGWGMARWIKPVEYEKPRDNDYRPNTDVILSTPVYSNVNATPGSELTVTYKINGAVIGTDNVVAPIKTESYSYLKWHTPTVDTVTTCDLEMSVLPYPEGTINCGGNEYTHRIVTIRPLDENTPPDPKVDDEKPVDLPNVLVPPTSVESGDKVDPTVAPVVKSVQAMTEPPYYKNETVKIQVVTNMATKNLSFTNSDTEAGKQFGVDSLGDGMLINRTVNKLSNEIVWTIEFVPINLGTNHYQFKALNSEQGESQALDFSVEVLVDPDMPEIFDITINPLKDLYTLYEETVSPPLQYMLIYNTNGGSDMASVMVDYNKTISAPGNPVMEGQSFKGWFKDNTLTELWNFSADKITGVTTLYAKWEISTYSVFFDLNGKGSPIAGVILTYGENIEKPADPEAIGCVFDGWYQDDALTDSWDFDNDTVSNNMTLHAKWKILVYVATFEEDKGSLVDDVKQDFGTKLVEPTTARLGYTLDGWYREDSFTTKWDYATDTLQDSITLYAKWIANDAFIEFNANEGSAVQKMSGKTDLVIDPTTLPATTRLGYTLDGWFKKEDLSGDALTKLPDQYPPGTTIYYAKWTANPSTIKFESNSGSAVTDLVGVTDQVITDNTMPITTRAGYTLDGWCASSDLSGAMVDALPDKYPVDGITYYAKWTANPSTIKFESNSGSAIGDLEGVTDQAIADKTMPTSTRAGYTLEGWYASSDLSGSKIEALPDQYPVDGITYYAKWTANPSTIKFESNGGGAVGDLVGVTDQAITDKTIPISTRADYTLEGWYESIDLSGSKVDNLPDQYPVDGITYYAKWKASFPVIGKALSEYTWAEVAQIADKGLGDDYFNIGDTKDLVANGETLTMQIYDFNHDDLASGAGKANITLGTKNLMATTRKINAFNTNYYGWEGSQLRGWMNGIITNYAGTDYTTGTTSLYSQLPAELQSDIKQVKKATSGGYNNDVLVTSNDKIFTFSEKEFFGTNKYTLAGEGTQYPIFTDDASRVKKMNNGTGSANFYWGRSPDAVINAPFVFVSIYGANGNDYAGYAHGINFGFCLGTEAPMPTLGTPLANCTWTQIANVANAGLGDDYWNIGDTKDLVANGETLTMKIYDFNHDDKADNSGKANITFGCQNLMATKRAMNSTNTNAGGWSESELRTWMNGPLYDQLPSDVQTGIEQVKKFTSNGNPGYDLISSTDSVFAFSEKETLGTNTLSIAGEGTRYPIFTTSTSLIKKLSNGTGSAYDYWGRSTYTGSVTFLGVNRNGSSAMISGYSYITKGIAFGFCF